MSIPTVNSTKIPVRVGRIPLAADLADIQDLFLEGTLMYAEDTQREYVHNGTSFVGVGLPRVSSEGSNATPSINAGAADMHSITALATNITAVTVTGTVVNGQELTVRVKDDGSSRNITWGTSFADYGGGLPTSTTAGKVETVKFVYDSVAAKWGCILAVTEV